MPNVVDVATKTVRFFSQSLKVLKVLFGLLVLAYAGMADALAQWQPEGPVEFVVMAGPGGGSDQSARLIAKIIAEKKLAPVPFKVRNIAQNSGLDALKHLYSNIGNDRVLMFTLNSFFTVPLKERSFNFDISQFTPIGRMGEDPFVLWVHGGRGDIASFKQFVQVAGQQSSGSGAWVMAGTGRGSADHLLTNMLNNRYNLRMSYIAVDGGGEVARRLAAKLVHSTVNNPSEQSAYFKEGKSKPLLVFSARRLTRLPDVPTAREIGFDLDYKMMRAVAGAAGMSAEAQSYYIELFARVFETAQWQGYREANGLTGDYLSGDKLMAYWLSQRRRHEELLAATGTVGVR